MHLLAALTRVMTRPLTFTGTAQRMPPYGRERTVTLRDYGRGYLLERDDAVPVGWFDQTADGMAGCVNGVGADVAVADDGKSAFIWIAWDWETEGQRA